MDSNLTEFGKHLLTKIDKIDTTLTEIQKTQASQHEVLREHVRRTQALEHTLAVEKLALEKQIALEKKKIEPVVRIYTVGWGLVKLVGLIGTMASTAYAVFRILK